MILKIYSGTRSFYAKTDVACRNLLFRYTTASFPSCCIANIIHGFYAATSQLTDEQLKYIEGEISVSCSGGNVVYATDTSEGLFTRVAEKLGFDIIDVNFNNNSGNNVYLFKKILRK